MKLKSIFTYLFISIICTAISPANVFAMDVPLISHTKIQLFGNDPSDDVGVNTMEVGQEGIINFGSVQYPVNGSVSYEVEAYIPVGSMITFSYNTSNFVSGEGDATAYASNLAGDSNVIVTALPGSGEVASATVSSLAFVSAQFVGGNSSNADIIIKNLSESAIKISSFLEQLYAAGPLASSSISFEVSEVPVPAALPMFGLGLIAMAGLGRRKKAQKAAA